MATEIEQKLRKYPSVCMTDTELTMMLNINSSQRYGQVKRAKERGDLIHIRRGLYCLGSHLTSQKPHTFELAHKIYWPSYITRESALSYHQLIPEAVYMVTSATTKRTKEFLSF